MREDLAQSHRSWGRVNLELRSQDSVGGRVTAYSGQWQIQLRESGLNEQVQETLQMFPEMILATRPLMGSVLMASRMRKHPNWLSTRVPRRQCLKWGSWMDPIDAVVRRAGRLSLASPALPHRTLGCLSVSVTGHLGCFLRDGSSPHQPGGET